MNKHKTVFVGLSGGVDSSVAALLLKKEGYNVIGAFIKSYNVDGCEEEDAEYARRAAEKLEIPFYVFDMREEYFSRVVAEMIDGYRRGITPNPDVLCNREIKFGLFWERAKALGADYIATGHYARIVRSPDTLAQGVSGATPKSYPSQGYRASLYTARDMNKDQTYFLWKLTQEDLEHCLFPIGEYEKPEVRKIAAEAGLPAAERKDSQGICFLGKVKLPEFLKKYIAPKKGDIVDTNGKKIGEHDGAWFYTIGQRHLNAKDVRHPEDVGHPGTNRKPYYVARKDVEKNVIVVAEGESNPALYKKEIQLTDVNFISPDFKIPTSKFQILCRVRYRQPLVPAHLLYSDYNISYSDYNILKVEFEEPVKFVAPGQSAVFYSTDEQTLPAGRQVLGGGVIC